MKPKVLFLVGPTASGKSEIAVEIAVALRGEIVSADSMQVYRGMDIGTAKPSPAELTQVPHHLIDILSPAQNFSVHDFQHLAATALKDVAKRGRIPIVVGGTGLYIRTLLDGISAQPGASEEIRNELEKNVQSDGILSLYQKLAEKDPTRAAEIKPTDKKRIIRALEIIRLSGKNPSQWHQEDKRNGIRESFDVCFAGLNWDREKLYRRIDARVEIMFQKGLVDETLKLMEQEISRTAGQSLGYKEIIQAIQNHLPLEEAKELIKKRTRNFAKRQWTWFKKESGLIWFEMDEKTEKSEVALKIMRAFGLAEAR